MKQLTRARIIQFLSIVIVDAIVLFLAAIVAPGFSINSFGAAILLVIAVSIIQAIVWWLFINFFAHLPTIFFPILTFLMVGVAITFFGNRLPGITIDPIGSGGIWTGIAIAILITIVNAILGAILVLDEDVSFDRNVTRKMVLKYGKPTKTDVPGFLFLEIDGLSMDILKRALAEGHMPTLKKWLDSGSHKLMQWETDFTAQTGAMQTGILMGNNDEIPAYRWWDRESGKMIMSGNPKDAVKIEARLSSGKGLLSNGGASRGNMFSGDATESLFTMSAITNTKRGRGPGFYTYLFNPFIIARLITRFIIEVIKEWFEAAQQRRRHKRGSKDDKYIVGARNPAYAFLRAFMGPMLQDLTTYTVISDVLRGVPAVYALYAGYDDLAHFAGMSSEEAFEALHETDHYFARIERALPDAPRPYHIVVLSDHGQSWGPTFKAAHGVTLEELVKGLVKGQVFAGLDTNEAWDNLNAVLTESTQDNTRTAGVIKRALASKTKDGAIEIGPDRDAKEAAPEEKEIEKANVVIFGSGSTGLIYFPESKTRMTYEQIQDAHPDLILGLINHPGIGLVIVKSETQGTMVMSKGGINYIDAGVVEGNHDPLAPFGPNAVLHVKRESSFEACPDIIVNTKFDPATQELAGFENQVSHHGGLGGPQNRPFILYPSTLPYDGQPVMWATGVYKLLYGWRTQAQGEGNDATDTAPSSVGAK